MNIKKWWQSKLVWANSIALVLFALQAMGVITKPIPIEAQATILAAVDIILRLVTNTGLEA